MTDTYNQPDAYFTPAELMRVSVEPSTRFDEDVHRLRISMRRMGEELQAAAQDAADAIRPFFDALADDLLRRR